MRCSKRTFAGLICLALVAACDRSPLGLVTFEGEVSPKLELNGEMTFDSMQESFLCQKYLLQRPTQKSESVACKFTRSGYHYQLVFDTKDMPRGGFCEWKVSEIRVESSLKGKIMDSTVLTITPVESSVAYAQNLPFLEPRVKSTCRRDSQQRHAACKPAQRILVDPPQELRTGLDVAFDEGPAPVQK